MLQKTTVSLALGLLTAVQASNPVFGAYQTDSCDACLDQTYESCPGDYKTRSYATCMCAGDGSANFVSCLPSCDPNKNEPAIASSTYYGYCVLFFKELCDGAQEFLSEDIYNKQCSKEAIAAGGIGAKDGDDDSEESEPSKTKDSSSRETDESGESGEANASETTKTSGSAQSTSTSGALATMVPAWAIVAGMGLQLMNV
ncbi:hypothetical protein FVEG_00261 [Fusarium verticillioides 7600]|uniref:Extracellular membrane protein CFEM domain-containing protein n=1 Tax=Gibberella moniliformis (strain M3125 / FGSC 7600) TaxID=334819 RepID=W7LBX2_GIBM7|nr:hypothetical protein FVEG_00261 [Fusarium verticillioides 7600]EWG36106.1 hypothetical protein FVEG_00261 [Fusarium verticillioides 7600]